MSHGEGGKVLETMALVHICWGFYIFNFVDLFFSLCLFFFAAFCLLSSLPSEVSRRALGHFTLTAFIFFQLFSNLLMLMLWHIRKTYTSSFLLPTKEHSKVRNQFIFTTWSESQVGWCVIFSIIQHDLALTLTESWNNRWLENLGYLACFSPWILKTKLSSPMWQIS